MCPGGSGAARILRTPSGPKGSSGNQVILGAAGEPARAFCFNSKSRSIKFQYKMVDSKLFLSWKNAVSNEH